MTLSIVYSPEVAEARAKGLPLVALESTIITHGMPFPQNVETAKRVEAEVRAHGAVPATIAIINGVLHVGLTDEQLDVLGQLKGVMKVSRADMPVCMAKGANGATTVAATMIGAHLAGIEVFATGGIGGVHKGAETSFDISADLQELAQTPVTVVCAGAKAILDLPKTFEYLETLGVPVMTLGQDEIPAFWSRQSGIKTPLRFEAASEVAAAMKMRAAMGLPGGHLVTNPIPAEFEIAAEVLAPHIAQALREADEQGISAKAVTPFLLQRLFELTQGASLVANIELVLNNARVASAIAVALKA